MCIKQSFMVNNNVPIRNKSIYDDSEKSQRSLLKNNLFNLKSNPPKNKFE